MIKTLTALFTIVDGFCLEFDKEGYNLNFQITQTLETGMDK
jgi:hypothetical protein